jgi:hypothetical protein
MTGCNLGKMFYLLVRNHMLNMFFSLKVSSKECPIDASKVWSIQLADQPLTQLKPDAFKDFLNSSLFKIEIFI